MTETIRLQLGSTTTRTHCGNCLVQVNPTTMPATICAAFGDREDGRDSILEYDRERRSYIRHPDCIAAADGPKTYTARARGKR